MVSTLFRSPLFRSPLALTLGFLALACPTVQAQVPGQPDPTGAVVTYWYQHSQQRETALKNLIARFNRTNPWKITVNGEYAGTYADIANKMSAGIAGGVTPDLVVAYQNDAATYRQAGAVVDLEPYVHDPKYGISQADLDDYFPDFLAQDLNPRYPGERLGWPPNRSLEVLYYNADWLRALGVTAPPKTWADFAADCRKAADPSKGTTGYEVKTDASEVFAQVVSRGGSFKSSDGLRYQLDTAPVRETFTYMQNLYQSGAARKVAEVHGDQTDFANRKVLFVLDSSAGIPFYIKAINGIPGGPFRWGIAEVPHDGPQPVLDVYGASVTIVKSTPARQLAAWLFLRWMGEPKQQAEWVRGSNYFPVRKSTAGELTDYLKANPAFAEAFGLLKSSRQISEPSFAGYEQVRDAVTAAFNSVLDGADVAAATANLQKKAEKIQTRTN